MNEQVDAIVNAANDRLRHGGGVAGVISRAGGPVIQQESSVWVREHGPVSHAEPAYTSAGDLPCKYVIHAVGPIWGSGDEERKLTDAVRGSIQLANELGLASVTLPAISCGIYRYPEDQASRIIIRTISQELDKESALEKVRLILFSIDSMETFIDAWEETAA